MKCSRSAAAWTSKAGQRAKWAHREERRLPWLKKEKNQASNNGRQPEQSRSQPPIDYLINNHEMAKLTR